MMKKLMVLTLTLVLIAAMAVTTANAQEVNIPDAELAKAIRATLGRTIGLDAGAPITAAAMRELTELSTGGLEIVDLTGLQHATNLKFLSFVWQKKVSDISVLANLTNLERLFLEKTNVSDVSPLATLTNLRILELSDTNVSDISPLANLPNLEKLYISDTNVSDISPLANLPNLTHLGLGFTQVWDVAPLANFPKLEWLGLFGCPLNAAAYDTHIPALQAKGVRVSFDKDAAPVAGQPVVIPNVNLAKAIRGALGLDAGASITVTAMSKLTRFTVWWAADLTGLEYAVNLTSLDIRSSSNVSDISALANLTELETLNLPSDDVSDISALANLTKLKRLNLRFTDVSDVSPLQNLTNLEDLRLGHTDVSDISALANLTKLEVLGLSYTDVSDISALVNLPKLEQLDLEDITLSADSQTHFLAMEKKGIKGSHNFNLDVEANLAKCLNKKIPASAGKTLFRRSWLENLSSLICHDPTNVSDISALRYCTNLEDLTLGTNWDVYTPTGTSSNVEDISALANLTKLKDLRLSGSNVEDISALANLTNLEYLELNRTKVEDISVLANLTKLEMLELGNTKVSDISALAKLPNLEQLDLENTPLSDASYKVLNAMRTDGIGVIVTPSPARTISGLWIPFGKKLPDKSGNRFIILTQYGNNCGPTSLEMVLHYYSKITPLDEIRDAGGIHEVWVGTWPSEMEQALNELGVPAHWYDEDTGNFKDDPFGYLRYFVRENQPSCILLRYRNSAGNIRYHWVVVVGYNTETNAYLLADPAKDKKGGAFRWVSRSKLDKWWGFKSLDKGDVSYWDEVWDEELGELVSPIVAGGFDPFGFAVNFVADPYTVIRPTSAPTIRVKNLRTEYGWNGVTGDGNGPKGFHRVKGKVKFGFERDWSHTIYFNKPFHFYTVSAIKVDWAKFNFGGTATLTGHGKVGNAVTIRGRVSDGLVVRGVLDVLVRPYYDVDAVRSEIIGAPAQLALPAETSLLPNYPNPFNPETWIPYQLSEAAEVTVTIHASDGKLVRTLELGQVPAGVYSDRGRAAYWDGRNAQGEPVASGVYFYTLSAGDFKATRKMVIRK